MRQGRAASHKAGSRGGYASRTPRRDDLGERLKRVFGIDIATCPACGGAVRILACIEDPVVIEKILTHLDVKGGEPEAPKAPRRPQPSRAPPQRGLFDETG